MVNWPAMGQVLLYALVTGAVLVSAFSFGLVGLDRFETGRRGTGAATRSAGALALAVACFAVCVAGVGLGLWTMLHK